MKIRISTIPPEGLKVADHIPLSSLNARMNEGSESEIQFVEAPYVDVVVYRNPNGAETRGKVTSRYTQPCARCDDGVERTIESRLDYILKRQPEDGTWEDDIGIVYFQGDHFDLEDLVQETLILSLSLYWSPPLDNKGDCTSCHRSFGAPLNEEKKGTTRMEELLRKAAEKKFKRP